MVLDPAFGKELEGVFQADLERSEEIHLAEFRKRPRLARIAEWGANVIAPLL
jgi:hypothetical protein